MKIPYQIIINEKIKMIKLDEKFDENELITNLKNINDTAIRDYLGFDEDIKKEVEEIQQKILKKKNIYYSIYRENEFIGWFYLYDINEKYNRRYK